MNILKRATDDITRLLEMGSDVFSVDKDGWVLKSGEPYLLSPDPSTPGKKCLVLRDPLPEGEYFLINPYGEGAGLHSTPMNFFYRVMVAGLVQSLVCCTTNVALYLIKASKGEIDKVPPEVLKVVSRNKIGDDILADVVDARMGKEFEKIDALVATRIHLIYPPKKMRVALHFENMTVEALKQDLGKSVREKSIQVYMAILYGILDCSGEDDLGRFTTVYDPDSKAPPKLWCFLNSLLKCFLACSGVLEEVGLFPKKMDLAELTAIIERVPEVFKQSRHVIQVEYSRAENAKTARPKATVSHTAAPAEKTSQTGSSFRDRIFGKKEQTLEISRKFEDPKPAIKRGFRIHHFTDDGSLTSGTSRVFSDNLSMPGGRVFSDGSTGRIFENSSPRRLFT